MNPTFTAGLAGLRPGPRVRHRPGPGALTRRTSRGWSGWCSTCAENFFPGEDFVDLADAQRRVESWCASTAGLRVHGTHAQRPAELFAAAEASRLLPAPAGRYDVPIFANPKVARDHHIEVAAGSTRCPAS